MQRFRVFNYTWLLIALCSLLLAACGGTPAAAVRDPAAGAGEPYRLGAILSITGPAASIGVPERDTLLMLQQQVNNAGGIKGPDGALHPLELTIIDDKSVEPDAVLAAKKLIEQQVVAIIGPSQTGTSLAVVPLATEAQIPLISLGASRQIVEPIAERTWIFKTTQNDRLMIELLMQDLKRRRLDNVAFLSVNNAFGESGRSEFAAAAQSHGVDVLVDDRYAAEDTDMSSQINRIKVSGAEALINWAVAPPSAVVTKNFADQGLQIPLYQSQAISNDTFLKLAGPAAEGLRFAGGKLLIAAQLPDSDPQKALLLDFTKAYSAMYQAPVSTFGGHAWDAFQIVTRALGSSGADPSALRDRIEQTSDFVGTSGIFSYSAQDHHGLDQRSLVMIEVRNGSWTLFEPDVQGGY